MKSAALFSREEHDACGVGFVVNRHPHATREPLIQALGALDSLEHRGACLADEVTGDGAGIMTDIPFELLGYQRGEVAVANLFIHGTPDEVQKVLDVVESTFDVFGLEFIEFRKVPTDTRVLGRLALETMPTLLQGIIRWPRFSRSASTMNRRLYHAKQKTRTRLKKLGLDEHLFFASLSCTNIVYKALVRSQDLSAFYPDLRNSAYKTRFALFHRRFSTNTRTSWDKAQPFRLIAHNGEINTIKGNRSWSYSREQALGLPRDELLTHANVSDSGNLNEMVESLKYRSSIPYVEDILAIMVPPAEGESNYYRFWSRAAEPWDGPALLTYCDGEAIGARSDRNGFRPCRWALTDENFFLSSEAGVFDIPADHVREKGALGAGQGVKVVLGKPEVYFRDPSRSYVNREAVLDPRLRALPDTAPVTEPRVLDKARLFGVSAEEHDRLLVPMIATGKEPIGSMGDTAAIAVLSDERRSFFDYFYQSFAQVTNPPLDYLREKMVTDLSVYLGRAPNIFVPKELIPPREGLFLPSPVLDLHELEAVRSFSRQKARVLDLDEDEMPPLAVHEIDITFDRHDRSQGLERALARIKDEAHQAVREGISILILSDEKASFERPPVPSLLALRAAVTRLNKWGLRLRTSVVMATADVRTSHHLAALIGFGATAVCPTYAFEVARFADVHALSELDVEERAQKLKAAFEGGLLKVMSKMGISVVRSYMSAKLFAAVGLGADLVQHYFRGLDSPIGGVGLEQLTDDILRFTAREAIADPTLPNLHLLKEAARGDVGERHSMTAARSRIVHALVEREQRPDRLDDDPLWQSYLEAGRHNEPITVRHLLALRPNAVPRSLDDVEPASSIMRRFGAGAMSFGAISAEAQRDIFIAMKNIGGRSNSGEGGENPYYYVDGTRASTKQVASGRFGVTAEYLVTAEELEIKIAQGAKPGEGGQLMGAKVGVDIARARHASVGKDLISPPPLHDIYSIEDLKELIYELKQIRPGVPVCVKLVSGANVGTVAVGAVKAGADIIQISGGDGGTGAATITSMKHAGLPWELGLAEVHRALEENDLRHHVRLRADGGLSSGEDIVMAALLGADEFGFGKLMLVAEGCIMARVCEKNTCPRGIATHDPRFKAKYRGTAAHVEELMRLIAEDVRRNLAIVGAATLDEVIGRTELLEEAARHRTLLRDRGLHLGTLLGASSPLRKARVPAFAIDTSDINRRLVRDASAVLDGEEERLEATYDVRSTDRGVLARLAGAMAEKTSARRLAAIAAGDDDKAREGSFGFAAGAISLTFKGSAGQGFGVFLVEGLDVRLEGEANDSVCKSMSGGRCVIRPPVEARFDAARSVIIGNCALYGATGGELFVSGRAGDRFAVRNSGARAVVDGAGLHACEYMTGGTVVFLGAVGRNVGAGMTGGEVFLRADQVSKVNRDYVVEAELLPDDVMLLHDLVAEHARRTGAQSSTSLIASWAEAQKAFVRLVPVGTSISKQKAAAA